MDIAPNYEFVKDVKNRLKNSKEISFSAHLLEGLTTRPLAESEILQMIHNPENLIHVVVQERSDGARYKLYFRKSRNTDWIIIAVFNDSNIRIVTAFPQNTKRTRLREKWRKRFPKRL